MNRDTILGSFVLFISSLYLYYTTKLPEKAAIYPRFVILIVMVLSVAIIVQSIIKKEKYETKLFDGFRKNQFFFVLSCIVVYVSILKYVGYFISTALFLIICLQGLKVKTIPAIGIGLIYCLFIFVVFGILLKVPLPKGFII